MAMPPGRPLFFLATMLGGAAWGALLVVWNVSSVYRNTDDAVDDDDMPSFQPVPFVSSFARVIVLDLVFTLLIWFREHHDNSPHMFRLWVVLSFMSAWCVRVRARARSSLCFPLLTLFRSLARLCAPRAALFFALSGQWEWGETTRGGELLEMYGVRDLLRLHPLWPPDCDPQARQEQHARRLRARSYAFTMCYSIAALDLVMLQLASGTVSSSPLVNAVLLNGVTAALLDCHPGDQNRAECERVEVPLRDPRDHRARAGRAAARG